MSGHSFGDFVFLGGHGAYVWSAVGLCVVALVMELGSVRRARRHALRGVQRLHRRKGGRPL